MKALFALLVIINILLFSTMYWGGWITPYGGNQSAQALLNPDKIKLVPYKYPSSSAVVSAPAMSAVVAAVSAPAPALAIPDANKDVCLEWGEFSGTDLARSQQALAAFNLYNHLGQRNVEYASGYWVYIPPMKTHKDVLKKIAQLKTRGVSDYFVVQEEDPWVNAISLGVFKTREAAQKYLTYLNDHDVRTAKVGERISTLKFVVFELKHLDVATSAKITGLQKDFPDSVFKTMACN